MKKRVVSFILSLGMIFSLLSSTGRAANVVQSFTDVKENDWFYDSVQYVSQYGLMNGINSTTFNPQGSTSRGMIVTILYRLAGSPEITAPCPFYDVEDSKYYAHAITWASENGIVSGYSPIRFEPDDGITRQQIAVILYRYSNLKGYDTTAQASLQHYADVSRIGNYAIEAMAWANAIGLINGTNNNRLNPTGTATRAHVAAIFTRYCTEVLNTQTSGRYVAYQAVINEYERQYGEGAIAGNTLTGLCFADLIDFDQNGEEELLLVYQTPETQVTWMPICIYMLDGYGSSLYPYKANYSFSIYGYDGSQAIKLCDATGLEINKTDSQESVNIVRRNGAYYVLSNTFGIFDSYKYYYGFKDGSFQIVHYEFFLDSESVMTNSDNNLFYCEVDGSQYNKENWNSTAEQILNWSRSEETYGKFTLEDRNSQNLSALQSTLNKLTETKRNLMFQ